MLLPLDDLNEMRQLPISLVIIAIIINGIYNHSIYKFIATFLFEKGLTNRQKREWRKERYFKRKTMRYIRAAIKSLPEQDFSPNIERYHVWDIISNVITIVALVIISIVYYFVRENNLIIVATYAIFETFSVSTGVFYLSHQTSRDKNGKFVGFFRGECTLK